MPRNTRWSISSPTVLKMILFTISRDFRQKQRWNTLFVTWISISERWRKLASRKPLWSRTGIMVFDRFIGLWSVSEKMNKISSRKASENTSRNPGIFWWSQFQEKTPVLPYIKIVPDRFAPTRPTLFAFCLYANYWHRTHIPDPATAAAALC